MNTLNTVPKTGTFGASVDAINANFTLVQEAVSEVAGVASKGKGAYSSVSDLQSKYPTATDGDWAIVWDSTNSHYNIYTYAENSTAWVKGGVFDTSIMTDFVQQLEDGIADTIQDAKDAIDVAEQEAIDRISEYGGVALVNDLTTGGTTEALTAEQGKILNDNLGYLPDLIGGKKETLALFGNYGLNVFNGKIGQNGSSRLYITYLDCGDYIEMYGNRTDVYSPLCFTTTDIGGLSADEINALNLTFTKIFTFDNSIGNTTNYTRRYKALTAGYYLVCTFAGSAAPFVYRAFLGDFPFGEIRNFSFGEPWFRATLSTTVSPSDWRTQGAFVVWAHVCLGSADSLEIQTNVNQSGSFYSSLIATEDGWYMVSAERGKTTVGISNFKFIWNGFTNKDSVVEIYNHNIQQDMHYSSELYRRSLLNFFDSTYSLFRDGFNFYELGAKMYNSVKTYTNTNNTLKRISKSAYGYAHVPQMVIYNDYVYIMHMQNSTPSAGENPSTSTFELALDYFSLSRYNSSDFNCETDVTTLILGKIGTEYTTADGDTLSAVYAPGDGSMSLDGSTIHIVFPIRLDTVNETFISFNFDTSTKTIVEGTTNICSLVYEGQTYDFTLNNWVKILNSCNQRSVFVSSINMSSPFVKSGTTYFNTIQSAVSSFGCPGALISTTDFITFTVLDIPTWNIRGADEIMLGIDNGGLLMACRQQYGIPCIITARYNASGICSGWSNLPAGNSRPFMWTVSNITYMMYPIRENNRDAWHIVKQESTMYSKPYHTSWIHVATIPAQWDYPCVFVYNNVMYFACATNSRTRIQFGKLLINTASSASIANKLVSLLDS